MPERTPLTTEPTMPETLHPRSFPLWGSRLIEASAGTGKTWTIAALYVRLVLGHGAPETRFARPLMPPDILVMTFTRAATRELSDRIRARLLEATRCFRGEAVPHEADHYLQHLLADYADPAARQQAAWRLAMAAEGMDDASIHTIDAWCQRMLREHAFDSASLFEEELVADEEALLAQAVQDYWRQQCYGLSADALAQVLAIWPSVDALLADVQALLGKVPANAHAGRSLGQTLAQAHHEQHQQLEALRAFWRDRVAVMRGFVQSQDPPKDHGWDGRSFSLKNLSGWLDKLQHWADGQDADVVPALATGWTRLNHTTWADIRKDGAGPVHLTLAEQEAFNAFATLQIALQNLPQPSATARRHAAASVAQRLRQLKQQQGTFGFADMLERLDAALHSASGERLRDRIAAQYPVALIDEFQDTAPLQYRIFDQIYRTPDNDPERALLLIGDPKQSIYGFRGADIYSYLQARRATAGRHYALSVNYRSTHALVQAVNHSFLQAEARPPQQGQPGGAFQFAASDGSNPLPFVEVAAHGRQEQWVGAGAAMPAITLVHDLEMQSAGHTRYAFAQRCAEQIVVWLNDPTNGFQEEGKPLERLRPQDIAILVRTGTEAAAMRRALQKRNVASVYLSDKDSVFQSDEARDLVHWLRAVAAPQDATLVRAALALASVGLALDVLARLATQDDWFDEQADTLRALRQVWASQGVLAMLRQTIHRFGLAARWLQRDGGERSLTNYLHLAELLQHASADLEGEQALIRWLMNQIAENAEQSDEQVVRLESDADLIKIVTIHKSKGLEYPVVCLPFASSFRGFDKRYVTSALLPTARGERELVLDMNDEAQTRYEQERLRDDLRLLYVAMTRPRHALWLGFAAVKVGNGKACQTHHSAIGYLLGGAAPREAADWLVPLQALASAGTGIVLHSADAHTSVTRLAPRGHPAALQEVPDYRADFDRHWGIASYSRLTRDLKSPPQTLAQSSLATPPPAWPAHALSPLHVLRPADDEALPGGEAGEGTTPALPAATAGAGAGAGHAATPIWHHFQRGPLTGNWLHQQLDWLADQGFALRGNERLQQRLQARCEQGGYQESAPALVAWLTDVAHAPLPGLGVALADLPTARSEMEFWLPARQIDTAAIDTLCRDYLLQGAERPRLQTSTLHGMLMGFIDLVFEHEGRYWVLDYKSNALGADDSAYDDHGLRAAMATHRYDVQAAVYVLALHRLLQARLGSAYDPETQLGGAVYFFLRGLHGPAGGVYTLTLPTQALGALDAMLEPSPEPIA